MIIHCYRKKYLISPLLISLIMIPLFPIISLADADKIFKENSKAVVVIVTYDEKGKPIGQGSGFIVKQDGAIVTNYHVISNARNIKIKASDKILDVEGLLHTDKENDLVILKVKGKNLPTLKIGDIGKMNVGDKVYVISSPQGLENTISDGILSGIREITPLRKILQITAPVSKGSSGGPVFNKNGEVIGIATFLIEEAQNLNFAMPVNFIKDKIESKKVTALKDSEIDLSGLPDKEDYKKIVWFGVGDYYYEAGLYDDAIEAYTSVIAIDPNDANAYLSRGSAYHKKGQHDRAIKNYTKAIALDPNLDLAYFNRGLAYAKKGQHDRAIEDFNKAIALNPNDTQAYLFRGVAYVEKGQYDRAIEDYNKAIALNPNFADAYFYRGFAYFLSGNRGRAISDLQKACDMGKEVGCEVLQKALKNR